MNRLRIHPAAYAELEAATNWYAAQSVRAAARFAAEVEVAVETIHKYPERFARIDDSHRIYLLDRFPYFVAYRQKSGLVEVVAVRHTSQDQDAWKGR